MEKIRIGVICYDLQNFTSDFINRLCDECNDVAVIKAYPIMDKIGDIPIKFKYTIGGKTKGHIVKTYYDNTKYTPEGILLTPHYSNAVKCAFESDIILHYGIHSSTALIASLIGFVLRRKQVSVNQTLPLIWETKRRFWIRMMKKFFFNFCSFHISQSKVSNNTLRELYGLKEERIIYIPFEAGASSFKLKVGNLKSVDVPDSFTAKNPIRFIFVANLLKFKGVFLVIDALKILVDKGYHVHLDIIGPESINLSEPRVNDLVKYTEKLGIKKYASIFNEKSLDELIQFYSQSHVFVLPTLKDTFGKVLIEAAILGLPLITSDACGSVNSIVIDNYNGLVFKSGDVDSLAFAMESIMDSEKLKNMSKKSLEIVEDYISECELESKKYHDLFLKVAKIS
jgi:glycosyltransferase involved in cell wall biosynthesis